MRLRFAALVLFFSASSVFAAIPESQRNALLAIYNSTNGPSWTRAGGWGGAAGTECSWQGVSCDAGAATVTGLEVGYSGLSGTLPDVLGALPDLVNVGISGNAITGAFPTSVGQLKKLKTLRAMSTQFTSLPSSIGDATALEILDFGISRLSGPVPSRLNALTNLTRLDLFANELTGPIPDLSALTRLEVLRLNGNELTGPIPTSLFTLRALKDLRLGQNPISGPIPAGIELLTNLEILDLAESDLSGAIPEQLRQLTRLTELYLYSTRISGALPDLSTLTNLRQLRIYRTDISGPIPAWIGNLRSLQFLALGDQLTGSIPPSIAQLTALTELHLENNQLSGALPREVFTLPAIEVIHLGNNAFSGTIPSGIGALPGLRTLELYDNDLTGPLPADLFTSPTLEDLRMYDNAIGGEFPAQFAQLAKLRVLFVARNGFTGTLPAALGSLANLAYFDAGGNELTGSIPAAFGQLTEMRQLALWGNKLTSIDPQALAGMQKLDSLSLSSNDIGGSLPSELTTLANLRSLYLYDNDFSGVLPPQIANLTKLQYVDLSRNRLSGPIPPEVTSLRELISFRVGFNELSGTIPGAMWTLPKLQELSVPHNHISGSLPVTITPTLRHLDLGANRFSGAIPPEIGQLAALESFGASNNAFSGALPTQMRNLGSLRTNRLSLSYNALFSNDEQLTQFLNSRQLGGDWQSTQTVAPTGLRIESARANAIVASWSPVAYSSDPGAYLLAAARTPNGEPEVLYATPTKRVTSGILAGLTPSTTYYVTVRTVTYPHGDQQNEVRSTVAGPVQITTGTATQSPAAIAVTTYPSAMFQYSNAATAVAGFTVTNYGDVATTVTASSTDTFFTITTPSQSVAPGATEQFFVKGTLQPSGAYNGSVSLSGVGVPDNTLLRVSLLVADPPAGTVTAEASRSRVDVAAPPEQNPTGTAQFTNLGTATLTGIVTTDVAWIIPPAGVVTIPPGQTLTITFTIDRSKRPPGTESGTLVGSLYLVYATGASTTGRQLADPPPPGLASIKVVDTVTPGTTSNSIPALQTDEVALFLPGVGHLTGGSGEVFLSDISVVNSFGTADLTDLNFYYSPASGYPAGSYQAKSDKVAVGQALHFGDVITSVFGRTEQMGTLQIRTKDWDKLTINASFFNVSNKAGTYGNVVPVFRSDQAVMSGETMQLVGLRQDANARTNVFVQEMSGAATTFSITFYDASGGVLQINGANQLDGQVEAWTLFRQFGVPNGSVAATVRNTGGGRFVAFATPVDAQSGDFWSVVDWRHRSGAAAGEAKFVPVIGRSPGLNNTLFRSDVTLRNSGTTPAKVRADFFTNGAEEHREITVAPGTADVRTDVISSLFGNGGSAIGQLIVTPLEGDVDVASRTFATVQSLPGTFGMAVPTLSASNAIRLGQTRIISGVEIASQKTISARKGGSFRTNIGAVEISGNDVTVELRLTQQDPTARIAVQRTIATMRFDIPPYGFVFVTDLAQRLNAYGDLTNVNLVFQTIKGSGAALVFSSSVDNGTGDSLFRTE